MAKKKVTRNKAGATSRRPTAKKTTRKPPARKTTKKKVAKPAAKRTTTKKTAKKTTKQTARKVAPKKTAAKAAAGKTSKKPPAPATRKTAKKVSSRPKSLSRNKPPATPDADGYVIINGRRIRMISTTPQQPPPVKKRKTPNRAAAEPLAESSTKSVKTKLGKKNLDNFRNLLLLARGELVGDLSAMEAQALRSGGGNLSHMPIHMADIGTDTYDQDFMLGLAETERTRLREIDAALQRIDDRTYGICQMTNRAIPKARLNAKPWARYTIEAALEVEQGNAE